MANTILDSLIFPTRISSPAVGGPVWAAEVNINDGGYEDRNNPWAYPMHRYDVQWGMKEVADLEDVRDFFHICRGKYYGFRFQDPLDYKSCDVNSEPAITDQLILTASGGETSVQLIKTYQRSGYSLERKITRPYGTLLLKVNSTTLTEGTEYTLDSTTGLIDLTGGSAPYGALTATDEVYAGYYFHVPVRFDTNELPVQLLAGDVGAAAVPLVEIRE